ESGEPVLTWHENVLLAVMLDEQRRRVGRSDGAMFFPRNLAGLFVESDQKTGAGVVVPGEQDGVIDDERAQGISPRHFRIAAPGNVAVDPDELSIMRVAGYVCISESDVDGLCGHRWRIGGKVRFL